MSWLQVVLPTFAAGLLLIIPGFLLVRAGGGRSVAALGLAPAVSTSLVVVSSTVLWVARIPWSVWAFCSFTLIACFIALVLRRAAAVKWQSTATLVKPPNLRAVAVSVSIAALMLGTQLIYIFGSPDFISQTTDGVFHLNSVKYMIASGDGSIFAASLGLNDGPPSAYPAAWHSFAALVATTSGSSVTQAVTAANLIIGSVAWPLGAIFFVRQLLGNNTTATLWTGLLSTCFGAFPLRLLDWGVLYPNFLSTALVLPVAALVLMLLKRARGEDDFHPAMMTAVIVVTLPGIFFSHPSGALLIVALLLPLVVSCWIRHRSDRQDNRLDKKDFAALAAVTVMATAWITLRPIPLSTVMFNPPYENQSQAIGEALWITHSGLYPSLAMAPLVFIGVLTAIRRMKHRWLAISHLVFACLFVAVAGLAPSVIRAFFVGAWYEDYNRLAAAFVLTSLPLAVMGALALTQKVKCGMLRMRPLVSHRRIHILSSAAIMAVAFLLSYSASILPAAQSAKINFNIDKTSPMMSTDEHTLYQSLGDYVPTGQAVVGDPWNGSGLAYLYSGVRLTFPQIFTGMTSDKELVARHLNEASDRPDVCRAVRALDIHFVLTSSQAPFQRGYPTNGQYDGLKDIDKTDGFELVAKVGTASLHRVEACWG